MNYNNKHDETVCSDYITRRDFLSCTTVAGIGAASLMTAHANAESLSNINSLLAQQTQAATERHGTFYPQQNQVRNLLDLSGMWQFQLEPKVAVPARAER